MVYSIFAVRLYMQILLAKHEFIAKTDSNDHQFVNGHQSLSEFDAN